MSDKKTRGAGRTRNWTFLVWVDSAPQNWRDIIDEEHIEWVESPLHEHDINADGAQKKPHWHILVLYESVKTYEQIKELTDKLHTTIPQKCAGVKGLVRYMAHLDNPEKAQYSISQIIGHGGIDVTALLRPSSSERYQLIAEMMDFVEDNKIIEIQDLLLYARRKRFDDWFPLLCDNSAYIMGALLKSKRHRWEQSQNDTSTIEVDGDTGEVIG